MVLLITTIIVILSLLLLIFIFLLSNNNYKSNIKIKQINSYNLVLAKILNDFYYRLYLKKKKKELENNIKLFKIKINITKIFFIFIFLLKKFEHIYGELVSKLNEINKEIKKFSFTIPSDYSMTCKFHKYLTYIEDDFLNSIFNVKLVGIYTDTTLIILYNKFFIELGLDTYAYIKSSQITNCQLKILYDKKIEYNVGKYGFTSKITWLHARKDGQPDRRYSYNKKMYVNLYFYFSLSGFNFKVYNSKSIIEESQKVYNMMSNDVLEADKSGCFFLENIKCSKSFADFCIFYKNSYYKLDMITNKEFIVFENNNIKSIPIECGKVCDIEKYNNFLLEINNYKSNIGKHILVNDTLYTVIDFIDDNYLVEDEKYNKLQLSKSIHILSNDEYEYELLKKKNGTKLKAIKININDIYKTIDYGLIRIVEISNDNIKFYHQYNKKSILKINDFKLDIVLMKNVKIDYVFDFNVGDYVFYHLFGLLEIKDINNSSIILTDFFNKKYILLKEDFYIFKKIKLSYNLSQLNIDSLIIDIKGNYGIVFSISSTIQMLLLDTKEIININFWECTIIDADDNNFLNYLDENKYNISNDVKAKVFFKKDLYYFKDFMSIVKKWFKNPFYVTDCDYNLMKFENNKFMLKSRYDSFLDYLYEYSQKNDFYDYEYYLDSKDYDNYLSKCERKFIFVKINDYRYITLKKLNELNIRESHINHFIKQLKKQLFENNFISIELIKKQYDFKLIDLFQTSKDLLNFIKKCGFKSYKFASVDVITLNSSEYKQDVFENSIISVFKKNNITEIDEYDLFNLLNDTMGFKFDVDSFEIEANKFTSLFFSAELEKIYLYKDDYYKELYNE